jgi:hypothetical protein
MMPTKAEKFTYCMADAAGVLAAPCVAFDRGSRTIWRRALPVALLTCALEGCGAAPSFSLVGAYFPVWLASAVIGALAALIARLVFVATGLSTVLPFQLFVCAAIGTLAGILIWLLWAGI